MTVTLADALALGSAITTAVTTTVVETCTCGAVNNPELEMVPAVADQATDVWLVPLTAAVNCCDAPELRVSEEGETETFTPLDCPFTTIVKR